MYRRMRRRTAPPAATGAPSHPDGDALDPDTVAPVGPATLVATIAATAAELSGLRSQVAQFVRDNGGGDDVVDDLELIVSELATNVVRHTKDAEITLTLRVEEVDLTNEILTAAAASVEPSARAQRWTMHMTGAREVPDIDGVNAPPVEQESGRGLLIVRAVADDVEVDRAGGTVKCTLDG